LFYENDLLIARPCEFEHAEKFLFETERKNATTTRKEIEMKRSTVIILLVLIVLGLAMCTSKPDEGIVGTWQGTLVFPGAIELIVVYTISKTPDGELKATLLRPDQRDDEIPVTKIVLEDRHLFMEVASINGSFDGNISSDGSVIQGQWNHPDWSQPLELKKVEDVSKPLRPQEPIPPYPYKEEEVVYINREGPSRLAGTLTLPHEGCPCPAVLLISGGGPHNRDGLILGHRPFLVLADYLTRRGIAVLRVDDRGVGASMGDRSRATSEDYAKDALAGIQFLKNRTEIAPDRIGLVGHSEGGTIASLAAAQSSDVSFIVMMAGTGLPGDEYNFQFEESIGRALGESEEVIAGKRAIQERVYSVLKHEEDPTVVEAKLRSILGELDPPIQEPALEQTLRRYLSPWFRFSISHDPGETLKKVRCPVLALFGEKDLQVLPKGNVEAVQRALTSGGNEDFRVEVLPGLNHLFQTARTGLPAEYGKIVETVSPLALEAIADWILEHTREDSRL
jgi:pimeloyl-ACP methyl ester carboxylesterase